MKPQLVRLTPAINDTQWHCLCIGIEFGVVLVCIIAPSHVSSPFYKPKDVVQVLCDTRRLLRR